MAIDFIIDTYFLKMEDIFMFYVPWTFRIFCTEILCIYRYENRVIVIENSVDDR